MNVEEELHEPEEYGAAWLREVLQYIEGRIRLQCGEGHFAEELVAHEALEPPLHEVGDVVWIGVVDVSAFVGGDVHLEHFALRA